MRLLGLCANKALDYYLRITPPLLATPAAEAFDRAIQKARHDILQLDDHSDPGLPQMIHARSTLLAELPIRHGGFGHMSTSRLAPCAYLAGVRATQHDALMAQSDSQQALRIFTDDAYDRLADLLNAPISSFPTIAKSLPHSAAALASAPLSPSTRLTKTTARKIQAAIVIAVQSSARDVLRSDTHPDRIAGGGISKSASASYQLVTSRSQQTRMLMGTLWFRSNRCESDPFVHFARFYLGLLPLLRPWCDVHVKPDGSKHSICAADHDTNVLLQPDGSHCISCSVCFAPRHAAHERINNVYGDFGKEAGLIVLMNPSTDTAMAHQFGKYQSRILFPKRTTTTSAAKTAELRRALAEATVRDVERRTRALDTIRRLAAECPKDFGGLRVDSIIQAKNFLLWIDVGIVHSTAPSSIDSVLGFVRRLSAAELAAGGNFALNVLAGHVSPPLARYTRLKTTKYAPMVAAALAQVKQGKRTLAPLFTPCIFSHLGEMSNTAIETVELITRAYRTSLSSKFFEDGISVTRRTAEFRARFKDALMVANAAGFGTTLAAAGVPRVGKAVSSAFDRGGLPPWECQSV